MADHIPEWCLREMLGLQLGTEGWRRRFRRAEGRDREENEGEAGNGEWEARGRTDTTHVAGDD